MEMERLYDAVIIGGGPAGLTASLYLARAGYRVLVMEENNFGGQIVITEKVVNYPGIYEISGAELTGIMKKQGTRFGAEYLKAKVLSLCPDKDIKVINTDKGVFYAFSILIATGAHPRMIGFPGEEEYKGKGIAYCATCDGNFYKGKTIAVISDNKESEEEVDFLAELAEKVYFCPSYKTDYSRENVIRLPGFVKSVNGERHADGIMLSDGSIIAVDGVFFLKQTVSADVLLDGLEMNNGSVAALV